VVPRPGVFGHALADVLLGDAEPGGRLPMTWPAAEADVLTTTPADGVLPYVEGLHVGHRRYDRDGIDPLFPFGHGLGFSTWEVSRAPLVLARRLRRRLPSRRTDHGGDRNPAPFL
jgi:hypothetical protein